MRGGGGGWLQLFTLDGLGGFMTGYNIKQPLLQVLSSSSYNTPRAPIPAERVVFKKGEEREPHEGEKKKKKTGNPRTK